MCFLSIYLIVFVVYFLSCDGNGWLKSTKQGQGPTELNHETVDTDGHNKTAQENVDVCSQRPAHQRCITGQACGEITCMKNRACINYRYCGLNLSSKYVLAAKQLQACQLLQTYIYFSKGQFTPKWKPMLFQPHKKTVDLRITQTLISVLLTSCLFVTKQVCLSLCVQIWIFLDSNTYHN